MVKTKDGCHNCGENKNNICNFHEIKVSFEGNSPCNNVNWRLAENSRNPNKKIEIDPKLNNPFDRQVGGNHYKKEGVPDVTEWCMRHNIGCAEFNVIKYAFRHDKKNGIEDLRKAKHYLEFIAFLKYNENL